MLIKIEDHTIIPHEHQAGITYYKKINDMLFCIGFKSHVSFIIEKIKVPSSCGKTFGGDTIAIIINNKILFENDEIIQNSKIRKLQTESKRSQYFATYNKFNHDTIDFPTAIILTEVNMIKVKTFSHKIQNIYKNLKPNPNDKSYLI
jgi:hypothetical protein